MFNSPANGGTPSSPSAPPAGSQYRILIVEDDVNIARLIGVSLTPLGMDCRFATDGEAALEAFEQIQPHLVLLDLMLPKLDGRAVCAKIRETSTVPIIMLTALAKEDEQMQGFKIGADDYVAKPFSPKVLLARIVAQLRRVYRYDTDNAEGLVRQRDFAAVSESPSAAARDKPVPAGWASCDACGYMGPRAKFESENALGQRTSQCPNCNMSEHIAFSIG